VKVQVEREQDGRWIAEVPVIAGAMAYGTTRDEAVATPTGAFQPKDPHR